MLGYGIGITKLRMEPLLTLTNMLSEVELGGDPNRWVWKLDLDAILRLLVSCVISMML